MSSLIYFFKESLTGFTRNLSTALGSIVTGIIGLIYASRAKSLGFNGTPRTVGYVCSLIGLILGVLVCLLLVWLGAWSIGMFITLIERCL